MNLFGVMDISASALQAERVRAEVVAANMANAETTRTADGGPYRRQHVVFQAAGNDGFAATLLGSGGFEFTGSSLAAGSGLESGFGSRVAPGGVQVAGVLSDHSAPLRALRSDAPRCRPRWLRRLSGHQSAHRDGGPDGRDPLLRAKRNRRAGGEEHGHLVAGDIEVVTRQDLLHQVQGGNA